MTTEIANRLSALRKIHGLSQEALATALNVSRQAVSKWERGESSPDTDNIIALARLYGVSLDELLLFDPPIAEEKESVPEKADPPTEAVEDNASAEEYFDDVAEDAEASVIPEPAESDGYRIENEEYVVHIKNGVLTVTKKEKPRSNRRFFGKLFGRKK
ncbi:MAG: helix-turn-helix domain-containing protein [Clostridia bacterium]|nr:helix-turn-helix domain-containing protein [Clostridia bacterium]